MAWVSPHWWNSSFDLEPNRSSVPAKFQDLSSVTVKFLNLSSATAKFLNLLSVTVKFVYVDTQ